MDGINLFQKGAFLICGLLFAPAFTYQIFDVIVPIYTIISILIIISFYRYQKLYPYDPKREKIYKLPKKTKPGVELTWKQKFIGSWDKFEREGFIEVNNLSFKNTYDFIFIL